MEAIHQWLGRRVHSPKKVWAVWISKWMRYLMKTTLTTSRCHISQSSSQSQCIRWWAMSHHLWKRTRPIKILLKILWLEHAWITHHLWQEIIQKLGQEKTCQYFKKMTVWWSILLIRAPLLTTSIYKTTITCSPSAPETQPSRYLTNNRIYKIQIRMSWLRCSIILPKERVQARAHNLWNPIKPQTSSKIKHSN